MSCRPLSACLMLACSWHFLSSPSQATEPKPLPQNEWQIRTFRMPPGLWWSDCCAPPADPPGGTSTQGAIQESRSSWPLPSPTAPAKEWDDYIEKSSRLITRLIPAQGIMSPEGTLYVHDVMSGTFVARSTEDNLDMLEACVESMSHSIPTTVGLTLDIIEADTELVRRIVSETTSSSDHRAMWESLRSRIDGSNIVHIAHLPLEGRSGVKLTTRSGSEYVSDQGSRANPRALAKDGRAHPRVGTILEVTPVIMPNEFQVDADIALEHHFAPPTMREELVWSADAQNWRKEKRLDFHRAIVRTTLSQFSGTTRLIGVWNPEELSTPPARMQVAFLGVDVLKNMPEENTVLLSKLKEYMTRRGLPPQAENEKTAASPKTDNRTLPAGMVIQSFKVPRDFLITGFAALEKPTPSLPQDPAVLRDRYPTFLEIFGRFGITFPDGASISYVSTTSDLVMRNTPAMIDQLALIVEDLWKAQPKIMTHTLHIVEGDDAMIRRLANQAQGRGAQNSVWTQVEELIKNGQLKICSIARVDVQSEHTSLFEAGLAPRQIGGISEAPFSPENPSEAPGLIGPPKHLANKAPSLATALDHEQDRSRTAGTRLELNSFLGPDHYTMDLDLRLENDFRPPAHSTPASSSALGTENAEAPSLVFYYGSTSTSLTYYPGMTKLVSLWKATGPTEREPKDIMQAAFLRVDLVTLGKP